MFMYRCEHGHDMSSPEPLSECIGFVHGKPCEAPLQRYGPGSRRDQ